MDYNYTYTDPTYSSTGSSAMPIGVLVALFAFYFIFIIVVYVFFSLCLGNIFKKAGVPSWQAWVPFLNTWKLLEIGGQQGFWAVLSIIPIVNIASAVFIFIAMYHIGRKLGKDDMFVLWAILLPVVWYPWLAFDHSKWNESKGATRLDKPATV